MFTDGGEVQFWGPFKIVENDFWDGHEGVGRDGLSIVFRCSSSKQLGGDGCLPKGRTQYLTLT